MNEPNILADSSIWIDHINRRDEHLAELLRRRRILLHPMIIGEIALGSIRERTTVLTELNELPQAAAVPHSEVVAMVEWLKLYSSGIGFVDAHLLGAARLISDGAIWTRDKRLHAAAARLGVAYTP